MDHKIRCRHLTHLQKVFDHDSPHRAEGIIIPHGIFDVLKNKAHINNGTSKYTAEFSCDSIGVWWYSRGILDYSGSNALPILCYTGGSNSYRHCIFKEDLQKLSDEIGIGTRIVHYPSYASK
ncbi:MAG: hypothetical protein GY866_13440 [Proteobacteria bacterium]|nr:hypothetical protein [Pseudomonadota bacterium]